MPEVPEGCHVTKLERLAICARLPSLPSLREGNKLSDLRQDKVETVVVQVDVVIDVPQEGSPVGIDIIIEQER